MMSETGKLPSSYRDPSGFVFRSGNTMYRQVNLVYREHYDHLMQSGLYEKLTQKKWLIPHTETDGQALGATNYYKILLPQQIPFISYPYEWTFPMLQDAALRTLKVMRVSLEHDMILKDATPFNIQWLDNRMQLIDTLSFEKYEENKPWIAYRQFCECFLSPLLLMHYSKQPLQAMMLAYPEGIPLEITRSLLPWRSRFSLYTWMHIHLHAKYAGKHKGENEQRAHISKKKLLALVDSLQSLIKSLKPGIRQSTWGAYYEEASTREGYFPAKNDIITNWVNKLEGIHTATDFGANDGHFSRIVAAKGIHTIAMDADVLAISSLYEQLKKEKEVSIHPLLTDLSNPAPAIGINNQERDAFITRIANRDLGLALALIHHLCIGRNIPLTALAGFFASSCRKLIIEFVPVNDPKSEQLLLNKKNIYGWYHAEGFEKAFSSYFRILDKAQVTGTERVLYLMEGAS